MQGESREPKKDMVYVDAEGHVKHVKDAGAQLVERQTKGAAAGKAMRVVAGTHAGLLCTVLEIEPKVLPLLRCPAHRHNPISCVHCCGTDRGRSSALALSGFKSQSGHQG